MAGAAGCFLGGQWGNPCVAGTAGCFFGFLRYFYGLGAAGLFSFGVVAQWGSPCRAGTVDATEAMPHFPSGYW